MSRGTIYTIYKAVDRTVPIDKDKVVANFAEYQNRFGIGERKYGWNNVPDVVREEIVNGKTDNLLGDEHGSNWTSGWVLKETGECLAKVADWSFCSNSIFVFEEIFVIGTPECRIFTPVECREFVDAVDMAESYNELKKVAGGKFLAKKLADNMYLSQMQSGGYCRIFCPEGGKRAEDEDYENESKHVLSSVRDIMNTYLKLTGCDDAEEWRKDKPAKFFLTGTYYG